MEFLTDPVLLARIQFALTAMYHYVFVPLSIGLGLIVAIFETKYYRSQSVEDAAASRFWIKVFTATFALGVATGITMEFSFGTNWADYARFVGDIFGAPLAAEALLAFFLESVFLGVLLFGRKKVSGKFYLVSAWLVWLGSCLSALWIIIANSWMQTPAGAELSADGTQALLTNFLDAAFNATTAPRYFHTVDALLIMGAFTALAIAAWYLKKGLHTEFAMKTVRVASVVALCTTCLMVVFAHQSAVAVAEEQPTKFAMMEGAYNGEAMPLYAVGWVDEASQKVITPIAIPGGTSFLASGSFDTEYPGQRPGEKRHLRVRFHRRDHFRAPCEHRIPKLSLDGGNVRAYWAYYPAILRLHVPQGAHCLDALAAEPGHRFASVPLLSHRSRLVYCRNRPSTMGSVPRHQQPRGRKPAHTGLFFRICNLSRACHHAGAVPSYLSVPDHRMGTHRYPPYQGRPTHR